MVIVAVVATVLTAGALAGATASLSTMFSTGLSALGAGAGGALGLTGAALTGTGVAAGATTLGLAGFAVAGAVGSIASQLVGLATGVQDHFSWAQVGLAALGSAVGGSLAGSNLVGGATQGFGNVVARAAVGNAISQGIGVATGLQEHFQWSGVAAAALGAGVAYGVSDALTSTEMVPVELAGPTQDGSALWGSVRSNSSVFGASPWGNLARATLTGMASGLSTSLAKGGRVSAIQIATDAFGNALGNAFVEEFGRTGQQAETLQQAELTTGDFSRLDGQSYRSAPFVEPGAAWAADVAARRSGLNPYDMNALASKSTAGRAPALDYYDDSSARERGPLSDALDVQLQSDVTAIRKTYEARQRAPAVTNAAADRQRWDALQMGAWRGRTNQISVSAPAMVSQDIYTNMGDYAGTEMVPVDTRPVMGYVEQMRNVQGFFGELGVGGVKGLLNVIPETAAFAYRMTGYAAAGVVSLVNTDMSDRMFAQYEGVTGRLIPYENDIQEFGGVLSGLIGPSNVLRGAAVAGDMARARLATSIRTEYEMGWGNFVTNGVDVTSNPSVLNSSVSQALRSELMASGRPADFAARKTQEILKSGLELPTMRNASTGEFFYKLQPLDATGNPLNSVYWMNSSQYARVQGMNAAEISNAMGLPAPSAAHGAFNGWQVFETTPLVGARPLVFESQIAPATQGANYAARGLDYQTLIVNPSAWYPARPTRVIAGVH
jgi:hypothetical protein